MLFMEQNERTVPFLGGAGFTVYRILPYTHSVGLKTGLYYILPRQVLKTPSNVNREH